MSGIAAFKWPLNISEPDCGTTDAVASSCQSARWTEDFFKEQNADNESGNHY